MSEFDSKKLNEMRTVFLNLRLSKDEEEKLKGGTQDQIMHSCSGLSIDCWCEPHCVSGKDCTSGWY